MKITRGVQKIALRDKHVENKIFTCWSDITINKYGGMWGIQVFRNHIEVTGNDDTEITRRILQPRKAPG